MSPLQAPRLVTSGTTEDGKSIFIGDEMVEAFHPFGPTRSGFYHLHSRLRVPVSNTSLPPASIAKTVPRCPPNGVNFGICDYPAGTSVPMHRTTSQDYAIVISGEVVCKLDGGEEKTLRAGEAMVQRGANHEWHNRTNETCRVMFVMVAAEKIVLADGTVFEQTMLGGPPAK